MISRFFKNYLSIIFFVVTMMSLFHHHHDLKQHNDCQICTVKSNILDADTPQISIYLKNIDLVHEIILTKLTTLQSRKIYNSIHVRAPPKIS